MKNICYLLFLLLFTVNINTKAQVFHKEYEKEFKRSLSEAVFGTDTRQFYLDRDGKYFLINTPAFLEVFDTQGNLIIDRDHIKKSGRFLSGLLEKSTGFSLKEGSSYMILKDEGIILVLDYTLEDNLLLAYDLNTGKKLWKREDLRYTATKHEQKSSVMENLMIQAAANKASQQMTVASANGEGFHNVSIHESQLINPGGVAAQAFITPLDSTGKFVLKTRKELVCLDDHTGKVAWRYGKRKINPAFHAMTSGDRVVLVGYSANALSNNVRNIVMLDTNTGKEIWHNTYLTNFVDGRTFVAGGNLFLDYYGVEAYNLKTGKRIMHSLSEGTISTSNFLTGGLKGKNNQAKSGSMHTLPSYTGEDGDYLYTYVRMSFNKKYGYAGESKPIIEKYDIHTGKEIWSTDKLSTETVILDENDNSLILKMPKGIRNYYIALLDKHTGKITKKTQKLKDYFVDTGTGISFSRNRIYAGIKDGLIVYNKNTLSKLSKIDTRHSSIGNLQSMGFYGDHVFFVGNKGLAFYDLSGKLIRESKIKKIQSGFWNDQCVYLFTDDNTYGISLSDLSDRQTLKLSPFADDVHLLFSRNAHYMVSIKNDKVIDLYHIGL